MTNLTEEQGIIVRAPLQGSIFLQGKAGTGKTTAGVNRMLHLVQSGCAADSILVMVPQRSLAHDYYTAVHHPDYPAAGHPSILTFGGLAQRMVSLFWPVIAKAAGFKKPAKPPKFLTLETAQYYLAGIVEPLVEKGYFDSVTIDPNRLYSQILDNLNKSAVVGFPPTEITGRLTEAWVGKPTQVTIYEQAQECALLFRNFCFQHNLLDFSLQLSVFQNFLWPSLICRKYLQNTFKHLIYDNIEEDIPIAHDMVADFLPGLESALLIMDSDAGFRTFLGADPISAFQLSKLCSGSMNFTDSFTSSADLQVLESNLAASIVNRTGSNKKIQLNSTFDVESFRFYPEAIDWACRVIRQLMDQDSVEPADIAVLTPFLSDSLRFTFATGFNDSGIPFLTYRPSRSLRDEPIIQAIMTLVKISNPSWGLKPSKQDVRNAFMCSIEGCDMVRAELLTQMLYSPALSPVFLKPFGPVKPEMQTRITYVVGERYEQLREWISSNQESGNEELAHWISRLFGEVLSQPGFGIHSDFDAAALVSRLIESCKGFRNGTIAPGGKPQQFGKEYARVLSSGILAAQSLSTWVQQSQTNSVFLSPAFSFLMSNRPVRFQFWIDIGSHGWWSRLDQPLTQPYVLNRNWQRGQKWTDEDEFHNNQRSLLNVTSGLLRRCREHVYLCTIGLNEQGVEERGALVMAVQDLLRRQKIARGERDV